MVSRLAVDGRLGAACVLGVLVGRGGRAGRLGRAEWAELVGRVDEEGASSTVPGGATGSSVNMAVTVEGSGVV